jgi:ABC-type multidrug transport system ATPase subunit
MKLEIEGVGKQYRADFWGLSDFTLELEPGVVGLLGENGAGKSTLMRIIATVTEPTTGEIRWNGADIRKSPDAIRTELGYLPQDFGVYPNLNAVEFLEYIGALKGVDRKQCKKKIDELLMLVNLYDVRKRPLGGYSGGMKQRIGIAQALINDPGILIVDEPTVGLDPTERVRFRNLLSDLSGERIVIFSTHIVSDAEATASKIAVVSKGRLLSYSEPDQLLRKVEGKVWEIVVPDSQLQEIRKSNIISGTIRSSKGVQVRVVSEAAPAVDAKKLEPTLEDAYLYCISTDKGGRGNG